MNAFKSCDKDGVYGLSWKEVKDCEDQFCLKMNVTCPTIEDFRIADKNTDEKITIDEFFKGNYVVKM